MKANVFFFIVIQLLPATPVFSDQTFVLNSSYSPPHSTEEQTGYLDLILKEAFRRAGFKAEIQMMPAERALHDSDDGLADGEIGRIRNINQIYRNLVIVDEPIIESRDFVAFSIHHDFATPDWESLAPFHVGIVRGWKILEANITKTQSLIRMESTRSLFRHLKNNRVDVVINARIDGLLTAKSLGLDHIRMMDPPLISVKLYLFMHRKNTNIIPALETALKQMKNDSSFHTIRNRVLADTVRQ